ncbi:xaa-Pro aminopeptidase 3 isoform X1 [Lucilia sericata]|uniref:xaa-Pro aminopeptidase 3 isoform X1 n=2 Tax=Lucilia sericata TaxID=13632 RepID=UPI0018A87E6F|nr:xaa-Pro aminopeptidase 3 isoform X1 [Lucilia sericata]
MWSFQSLRKCNLTKLIQVQLGFKKLASFSSASNGLSASRSQNTPNALNHQVFGQPVSATHPHLINDGELVAGVTLKEFQQRRTRLMLGIQKYARDHLQKNDLNKRNHLVVIPSSTKKYMSDKIPYIFRQNSDFFYLTGCQEPDTILVMSIDENSRINSSLFMRAKDKHAELWEGARTGVDLAIDLFGVDQAFSVENFEIELGRRIQFEKPLMWFDSKCSDLSNVNQSIMKVMHSINDGKTLQSPTTIIHGMRLFKSVAEQNLMRRTCQIASTAINEVMAESKPGHSEHHIYAMTDYKCRMRNASHLAYPPVVASGKNATVIHYINNTQLCKSGDLVLMDAGCEYGGYSSDITRTWPINGKFTDAQKTLYDVVLLLQKELIDTLLREGGETLDHLFDTMCLKLGKYLQEIGLVPNDINDIVGLTRAGYKFCPHHVSHYLGMDVHDTPLIPRSLRLMPGMVCTVEPGIYISPNRDDVPVEFRGIGIRIEDDILITDDNKVEILTSTCIKERTELENLHKLKT